MNLDTASIKAKLANQDWHIKSGQDASLLPQGTLVRYRDEADRQTAEAIVGFLRAYTDVANAAAALPYVDSPWVDGQQKAGRWRGGAVYLEEVPVRESSTPQLRVVQELRFYCHTALQSAHAELKDGRYLPDNTADAHGEERWFTLRYNNVAPDSLQALTDGVAIQDPVTNPTYRKWDGSGTVTITGDFYPVLATHGLAEDGSGFVEVMYAQSRFTIESYSDNAIWNETEVIYHFGVPKVLAQGIITAWKAKGRSATVDRSADTGLCTIILRRRIYNVTALTNVNTGENCDAVETTTYVWGVEEADLGNYDIPGTVNDGESYTRQVKNNGDGSFDVVIVKTVRSFRDIAIYTSAQDASQSTTSKQFKGVTDRVSQLGAYLDAPAVGETRTWRMAKLDDCTENWEVDTRTAVAMPFNTLFTDANTTEKSTAGTKTQKGGKNLTAANVATLQALVDAAVTEGIILGLEKSQNDDGTWNVRLTSDASNAMPFNALFTDANTTLKSISRTAYQKGGRNLTTANVATLQALVDAAASDGIILRLEKNQNSDGSWDVRLTGDVKVQDADSVVAFVASRTPDVEETLELIDGSPTQPALGGSDYGVISAEKRDGLWYGTKRLRTYTTSYSSNANWESSDNTYDLGLDEHDGRRICVRTVRAFTEAAADNALDFPAAETDEDSDAIDGTNYSRVPSSNGHRTGVFRHGPGQYTGIQVFKKKA